MTIVFGALSGFFLGLNTIVWAVPIYICAILKLFMPVRAIRRKLTHIMMRAAECWTTGNNFWFTHIVRVGWQFEGLEGLDPSRSYLVCANHQSWVDILVLQRAFNKRIPFPRFFLKKELIYVPVIGLAWWALDFPFMQRHSKEILDKHPEKRGEDLATTRRAAEKLRGKPVTILNFFEGTRFTDAKHAEGQSPYKYLLKPKAGGAAFVIQALGEQFQSLLDVTIHYPEGIPTMWTLMSGQLKTVHFSVRAVEIPRDFIEMNYLGDAGARSRFQSWIADLWSTKDRQLAAWNSK